MWPTFLLALTALNSGTFTSRPAVQEKLQQLASESDGRVGLCALDSAGIEPICINGDQKFPLQSVMKLIVAAAVMDAVDRKQMQLTTVIKVKPEDASPGPQEFADLVRSKGSLPSTVEDLMRRALVESDSTSVDLLIQRIGGIRAVQDFLKRKEILGIRIDRNERDLQAEFSGLVWKAEYADSKVFEAAVKNLSADKRDKALEAYSKDPRDTATPVAMVRFLKTLAAGQLLSEESTRKLLAIMTMTVTGPDRLKAGIPKTWTLAHKTGTSSTWNGRTAATNDVGILTAPDGGNIALAVFVADSNRSNGAREGIIAKASKIVTSAYSVKK